MTLAPVDWIIMAVYFAVSLGIGVAVSRLAGRDFSSYFLGSRNMPWWLLGVSMVATTFSTETPNLVTDLVRSSGTFGNWAWWAFLLTGMLTVFLYARLWRRSGVFTDVAFYELRYSGRLAAFLRAFRAGYLGILFNLIVMASVTLAAIKIGGVMLGWTPLQTILVAATITMVYSALGGLRGVLLTDLLQFVLAMVGSVGAAWYLVNLPEVGGWTNVIAHERVRGALTFWPDFGAMPWSELVPVFLIPIAVQWWAAYYPGAEPGGGGYIAQRMLAARDEAHATGATLLFNALHYGLRPWPWIIVALVSLIVFPDLASIAARFPHVSEQIIRNDIAYPAMMTMLPPGLLGIVVTSLAAAYMSTMSTHVNWGSSIIVHDLYARFFRPDASEHQLVWAGRVSTVVLMGAACMFALALENALQVFEILLQIGAGTGLIFLLRWFWWRINAASELVAMIVSFGIALYFQFVGGEGLQTWERLLLGVGMTTAAWLATAYLTRPTDDATLFAFYRIVQPGGPGWRVVVARARAQGVPLGAETATPFGPAFACAGLGALGIYAVLFATGFTLYGRSGLAVLFGGIALLCGIGLWRTWPRLRLRG